MVQCTNALCKNEAMDKNTVCKECYEKAEAEYAAEQDNAQAEAEAEAHARAQEADDFERGRDAQYAEHEAQVQYEQGPEY
jgi:hypothetical protein